MRRSYGKNWSCGQKKKKEKKKPSPGPGPFAFSTGRWHRQRIRSRRDRSASARQWPISYWHRTVAATTWPEEDTHHLTKTCSLQLGRKIKLALQRFFFVVGTSRDALCSKHPSTALLQNDCGVDSSLPERLFGRTHAVQAATGLSMRYPDPGDCQGDAAEPL